MDFKVDYALYSMQLPRTFIVNFLGSLILLLGLPRWFPVPPPATPMQVLESSHPRSYFGGSCIS